MTSPDGRSRAVLPLYCEYTFQGTDIWEGRPVYVIKAQYAARYRPGRSPEADSFLRNLSGKHVVALMIDQETREFLLMKDIMEEDYLFSDGTSLREKGFLLTFYKGIRLLDRTGLSRQVQTALADALGGEVPEDAGEDAEFDDSDETPDSSDSLENSIAALGNSGRSAGLGETGFCSAEARRGWL